MHYIEDNYNFINFKTQLKELINTIKTKKILIVRVININISKNSYDEIKVDYLNFMAQMGYFSSILGLLRIIIL